MASARPHRRKSLVSGVLRVLPIALMAVGVVLIVEAVVMGSATFYLVLVFPVVAGTSALLLLGSLFLIVGFFLLPWTLGGVEYEEEPPAVRGPTVAGPVESSAGGLILLGPVPLFLGSWKSAPGWAYWLAAAVGGALLLLFLLFVLGFL